MSRSLFALALLVAVATACGSDPADPHVVGACSGWNDNLGNPYTGQCEIACMTPPVAMGDTCDTTKVLNCAAFSFESQVDGCCVEDQGTIRFYECQ